MARSKPSMTVSPCGRISTALASDGFATGVERMRPRGCPLFASSSSVSLSIATAVTSSSKSATAVQCAWPASTSASGATRMRLSWRTSLSNSSAWSQPSSQ